MKLYELAGPMALGSRLRQFGERLMNDAEQIYAAYGVEIDPRWFPVFYMLNAKECASITELANDVGQTHPAVSQVVRMMTDRDIATTQKCTDDGRVNKVALTPKGKKIAERLTEQCQDVNAAVDGIFQRTGSHLWSDLDALERELEEHSMYEMVMAVRKERESRNVKIVPYKPRYKQVFKDLNVAWIEKHFEMEAADHKALDKPTENIINRGGYIAFALHDDEPVGTCALLKMEDDCFELAKMAVADKAKGLGIGYLLGKHMLEKAGELGASRVYLESNTALQPALNLYRKLGFRRISGVASPYDRCNIQMEIDL